MNRQESKTLLPKKIEILKESLDSGFKIRVHDLVMDEARVLFDQLTTEFSAMSNNPFNQEELIKRLNHYEDITKPLQTLMMLGCYWGEKEHERIWVKCLELIANLPSESGEDIWIKLRLYPALLLLYSGGIAAIAGERYRTFRALLTKAWLIDERKELPVVLGLNIPRIMEPNEARKLPGMQNHKTPLSDYLFNFLRESFKDFLPQDFLYQIYFDKFEYLSSLVYVDLNKKEVGPKEWGPIGCFGWRRIGQRENTIMEKINLEIENDREKWPPLKAGLFNGSLERFTKVKQAFDTFIADLNWY